MAALTAEITNDPLGLGYATLAQNSSAIAVRMNTAPEPIAVGNQEQIFRSRVETYLVTSKIDRAEFVALAQGVRDYLSVIFSTPFLQSGDANLRTQLGGAFAAGPSKTAMTAAVQKDATRAEALWGDGFRVTEQQVYTAQGLL
jgi:hypothetical protein